MAHVPPEGGDVDGVALDELGFAAARHGDADVLAAQPLGLQRPARRPMDVVLRQPQTIARDACAGDLRFSLFVDDRDHVAPPLASRSSLATSPATRRKLSIGWSRSRACTTRARSS